MSPSIEISSVLYRSKIFVRKRKLLIIFSQFISQVFTEKRPMDTVAVGALARAFETVGLTLFLNWWGVRTNPFD